MNFNKILDFVTEAFEGITDKANAPYIEHCLFVSNKSSELAKKLKLHKEEIELVRVIGLLHDVLEDLDYTKDSLVQELGQEYKKAVDVIDVLSKKRKESYDSYIKKVLENKYASIVKSADAFHNSMCIRFPENMLTEAIQEKCKKYKELSERCYNTAKELVNNTKLI